jgi:hypothetical protein
MCQHLVHRRGRAFYVGKPQIFLVCHNCFSSYVVRQNALRFVYQAAKRFTDKKGKPAMEGEIILNGEVASVDAATRLWPEHKMTFEKAPNVRPRKQPPSIIIWHWTGGENSAAGTYGTLINRGLGVAFCIDREGVIWQYCDPVKYDPRDTGGAIGLRSVSIEVANYGFRLRDQPIPLRGQDRATDDEKIHGVRLHVARFYPQQIYSIAALTKSLCRNLNIPMRFPRETDGSIAYRVLTNPEKRKFRGIMGHFHKTKQKYDPGFDLFRQLEHLEVQ